MKIRVSQLIMAALLSFIFLICISAKPTNAGSSIKVMVDPRMELLSAVQAVSKNGERPGMPRTPFSFQYKQEMTEYFAPYREHRAVAMYDRMFVRFFNYDAPPTLMLYLSDPPDLQPQWRFGSNVRKLAQLHRAGSKGVADMIEFVGALRDFARVSKFDKFYVAHQQTYRMLIEQTESKISNTDIITPLENYYGKSKKLKYTIVLVPLFHPGGYGPSLDHPDGSSEIYNICGPLDVSNGLPVFGDAECVQELAWHEFGHSFVNPLADKYWSRLKPLSSLYTPVSGAMERLSYGNWKTCVNEHIVRAVHARIIYAEKGKTAAESFINDQRVEGFAYIRRLYDRLEEYKQHREKYSTFQDFYPRLIDELELLEREKPGPEYFRASRTDIVMYILKRVYRYRRDWFVIFVSTMVVLPAISSVLVYRDCRRRGKPGLVASLAVMLIAWPIGLIVWLLLRRRERLKTGKLIILGVSGHR